jgi:hypothetical protein
MRTAQSSCGQSPLVRLAFAVRGFRHRGNFDRISETWLISVKSKIAASVLPVVVAIVPN